MSNRYKGAVISATAPTTTGGPTGVASGAWTLEQQMQLQAASLWPSQPPPNYIEDVFSTYLYKGNSLTQTITNNIDLSTKGGLVWIKSRDTTFDHMLLDTARGVTKYLNSNNTATESTNAFQLTSFNSNGFTLGDGNFTNNSSYNYVSWTFREQPKFFDIVTWTGNGSTQTINHNLGSTPGCVIIKQLNAVSLVGWVTYHRSVTNPNDNYLLLNTTDAPASAPAWISPNSTSFTVGNYDDINKNGNTYVAYLWAHDAGGFGTSGTDNVISCGSFTTDGSGNATVSLGYEPQWLMVKASSAVQNWYIEDNMRAFNLTSRAILFPSLPNAEATGATAYLAPNSTGFAAVNGQLNASTTYIYIAIRRGPMAVPTVGTTVFTSVAQNFSSSATTVTTGFPVDLNITADRNKTVSSLTFAFDRLRGLPLLATNSTAAESTPAGSITFASNTSVRDAFWGPDQGASGQAGIYWNWRRAPGFFDEVCYTGNATSGRTINHNLGAVPEMMIVKVRNDTDNWQVYHKDLGATKYINLNTTSAAQTATDRWNDTSPTNSVFTVGNGFGVNYSSAYNYVAYLFATCAGVSKVGTYTGTGTTQTINCGFTGGARFVLIKRTDSTGDWYVWDSARGIIAGNDPYLLLNSTAAEVTNTDYVDTAATGFEISSTAPAAINANGGTFIFLAIA